MMMTTAKRNGVRSSDGGNERGKSVWSGNNSSNNEATTTTKISTSDGGESSSTAVAHRDRRIVKSSFDSKDLSSGEGNAGKQNSQNGQRPFKSWPITIKGGRKRVENRGEIRSQNPQTSSCLLPKGRFVTQGNRKEFANNDPIVSSSSCPHRCDYVVGKNSGVLKLETNNNNLLVCESDSPPCYNRRWSGEFFNVPPIGPSIPEQQSSVYNSTTIETSSSTFQSLQKFVALGPSSPSEVNSERGKAWKLQSPDGTLIKVFDWGFVLAGEYGVEHCRKCPLGSKGQADGWPLRLGDAKIIGRGASSTVYLGFDAIMGRKCAVKVINIVDANRQQQVAKEIVAFTHCLAYPSESLVNFLGAHRGSEGQVRIALEYMDCGSLKDHIQHLKGKLANSIRTKMSPLSKYGALSVQKAEHTFPEHVLVAIGWQILQGLRHLHSLKLLHCDIKPSNILLNRKGEVKLTDLGISAQLTKVGGTTNGAIGSIQYMSPERLEGMSYGWQADIWSFGLILLECASLCSPWDTSMGEVEQLQIIAEQGSRGLIRRYGQHLSSAFQDFVASCLHVKPNLRKSVDELFGSRWFILHGVSSRDFSLDIMEDYLSEREFDI